MRIYFVTKRNLLTTGVLLLLICGFLGVSMVYFNHTGVATPKKSPVYQAIPDRKL